MREPTRRFARARSTRGCSRVVPTSGWRSACAACRGGSRFGDARSFALVVRHESRLALSFSRGLAFVSCGWVQIGRYHRGMAQATKLTKAEIERRRAAAERMRGLFADVAPGRSLVDELIADRRAEAAAESGESTVRRSRGG